jgi:DNA-directed RNA polymerase specialized sigma24 family protein
MSSINLENLAEQLRAGSTTAAGAVYNRFVGRLVSLAQSRLDPRLAAKVDPEDVAHSALRSFFVRAGDGQLVLDDPDRLWGLLALITLRKCRKQARIHRDVRREVAADADDAGDLILDREPTPEEAACLSETVGRVMDRLGSPLKRRILELSLQGYSVAEIADTLSHYERGVKRVRAEIRELLGRGEVD